MLKVPTQNFETPPIDAIQPEEGMDAYFGGDSVGMINQEPEMSSSQENYDADFNAGVEANEEEDPKKYIQQLTGKLSQSLRKYNESLPQPDAELSKYVAGMIIKQAVEGLSQDDVSDIVDKANTDTEQQDMQGETDSEQTAFEQGSEQNLEQTDTQMNETTGSTLASANKSKTPGLQIKKGGYSRKPYLTTV